MKTNNRVIKFRCWNKDSKRWVTNLALNVDNDFNSYKDWFVFPQYTGLLDKNGVEVFEGDIVKLHRFTQILGESLGVIEGEREDIGQIAIEPLGIWFESKDEESSGYILLFDGIHEESFEVIGNIYENESLLTNSTLTNKK